MSKYANGVALVVAHWSMDFLSDLASPVVAAHSFRCGIFLLGLATAAKEGNSRIDLCLEPPMRRTFVLAMG